MSNSYDPDKHHIFRLFHTLQEAQAAHNRVSIINMYSDYGGLTELTEADLDDLEGRWGRRPEERWGLYIDESCRRYSKTWQDMCNAVDDFMVGFREGMKAQQALVRQDPRWDPVIEHHKDKEAGREELLIESPDGAQHRLTRRWREDPVFNPELGYNEWVCTYYWSGLQTRTADDMPAYERYSHDLLPSVKSARAAVKAYLKGWAERANDDQS